MTQTHPTSDAVFFSSALNWCSKMSTPERFSSGGRSRSSSKQLFSLRAATLGFSVTLARWCSLREIFAQVLRRLPKMACVNFGSLQSRAAWLPSCTNIFDFPMNASGLIWKNGCESSMLKNEQGVDCR